MMDSISGKGSDAANRAKAADKINLMYQLRSFASVANFNQLERNDSGAVNTPGAAHGPPVDHIDLARQRLKKIMAQTWMGRYYENVLLFLSVASCLEYIYQTYLHPSLDEDQHQLYNLAILEIVFASIFAFDWCLNCFLAEHRIIFFTSFFSMVDIFTVIPIFVTYERVMPNVNYITTLHDALLYMAFGMYTTRILRALRIRRKLAKIEDAVERFMAELILSIIVMILFFASVMQFLEYTYQPHDYHTWMYYIWVTISTVGYGDITPKSTQGRVAVMCIIGFSIISIPKMTNELIEKMALQSVYMRNSYTPKSNTSKHIVICGDITSMSLNEFFEELFHEDHENVDLNAILLLPTPPTTEMIFLLRDSSFFLNLMYLEGSALIDNDLRRAKAQLAVAIFVMTNKFSNKPDEEDAKSILLSLSIKRYVASFNIPPKLFCLQLIRPSNRKHLGKDPHEPAVSEDKDLVVCLNEIKMGVLAKAVMYPGANTLLMNLISSFSDDEIPGADGEEGGDNQWITEYTQGCGWEIYTSLLSPRFQGKKFSTVSYDMYKKKGVILFALQIPDAQNPKQSRLLLNPAEYVIPDSKLESILAFVIAENKATSDLTGEESPPEARSSFFGSTARRVSTVGELMHHSAVEGMKHKMPWKFGPKDSSEDLLMSNNSDSIVDRIGFTHVTRPSNVEISTSLTQSALQVESRNELLIRLKETHFKTSYYLREQPAVLKDCTVKGSVLDVVPGIKNHIIIIGKGMTNLFDLIRPLRAKYVGVLRPIVILSPDTIEHDVWSRISMFDAIWVVRGSPLEERNLRRAGIFQAKRVVVLADGTAESSGEAGSMAALVDSDAIFAYQRVRKMNPQAQVVIEIVNTSNVGYLYTPSRSRESPPPSDYKFSTQFAAGELFTTSLLDSIVCQGYYNPHIISVIDKLISGVDITARNELLGHVNDTAPKHTPHSSPGQKNTPQLAALAGAGAIYRSESNDSQDTASSVDVQGSCLYQIPLPPDMATSTYGSLYKRLSKKGIIPLGLLRGTGSPHLAAPYVYTNPNYDTDLNSYDRVFILSVKPIQESADETTKSPTATAADAARAAANTTTLSKNQDFSSDSAKLEQSRNADFSALTATQKQLQEDLRSLSSDVNRKFESILTLLQNSPAAGSTQSTNQSSSVPTAPSASDTQNHRASAAPAQAHPVVELKSAVRLAPLPQIRPQQVEPKDEIQYETTEHDEQEDSFPTDGSADVHITSVRTSSTSSNGGSGGGNGNGNGVPGLVNVFSFQRNRSRSRSSSIGIDTSVPGALEQSLNGVNYNLKNKPNPVVKK